MKKRYLFKQTLVCVLVVIMMWHNIVTAYGEIVVDQFKANGLNYSCTYLLNNNFYDVYQMDISDNYMGYIVFYDQLHNCIVTDHDIIDQLKKIWLVRAKDPVTGEYLLEDAAQTIINAADEGQIVIYRYNIAKFFAEQSAFLGGSFIAGGGIGGCVGALKNKWASVKPETAITYLHTFLEVANNTLICSAFEKSKDNMKSVIAAYTAPEDLLRSYDYASGIYETFVRGNDQFIESSIFLSKYYIDGGKLSDDRFFGTYEKIAAMQVKSALDGAKNSPVAQVVDIVSNGVDHNKALQSFISLMQDGETVDILLSIISNFEFANSNIPLANNTGVQTLEAAFCLNNMEKIFSNSQKYMKAMKVIGPLQDMISLCTSESVDLRNYYSGVMTYERNYSSGTYNLNTLIATDNGFYDDKTMMLGDHQEWNHEYDDADYFSKSITLNYDRYALEVDCEHGRIMKTLNKDLYRDGDQETITVTADEGYIFSGWTGSNTGNSETINISMKSDVYIKANFISVQENTGEQSLTLIKGNEGNDISHKQSVPLNSKILGTVKLLEGSDWYRIYIPEEKDLRIRISSNDSVHLMLSIMSYDNYDLSPLFNHGGSASRVYTLTPGFYEVAIGCSSGWNETGDYSIELYEDSGSIYTQEIEPNNSQSSAQEIKVSTVVEGVLTESTNSNGSVYSHDGDMYRLKLPTAGRLNMCFSSELPAEAKLMTETLTTINSYVNDLSINEIITSDWLEAGTYYFQVYKNSSEPLAQYTLQSSLDISKDYNEKAYNNTLPYAQVINLEDDIHGAFVKNDYADFYRLNVDRSGLVSINIDSDIPLKVKVYDDYHRVALEAGDGITNSININEWLPIERYYIELTRFDIEEHGEYTMSSTIKIPEGYNEIEYNDTIPYAKIIDMDDVINGMFVINDNADVYRVYVDKYFDFSALVHSDIPVNVQLISNDHKLIAKSGNEYTRDVIADEWLKPGYYYLMIQKSNSEDYGAYQLSMYQEEVEGYNEVEYNNAYYGSPLCIFGDEVIGSLVYGDAVDIYKVDMQYDGLFNLEFTGDVSMDVRLIDNRNLQAAIPSQADGINTGLAYSQWLRAGVYYVYIKPHMDGVYGSYHFVTDVYVPEGYNEKTYNDVYQESQRITFDDKWIGSFVQNDTVDWYSINVP